MDKRILAVMILLFSSVRGTFVHAQAPQRKEDLVDQVKSSIDRGVQYLRQTQQNDGSWKTDLILLDYRGGETALGVLALLNCGVSTSDPAVKNGLRFLRGLESNKTYVRALQTMALAEAGSPFDAELIKNNIDWLLSARVLDKDGKLIGWTYGKGIANRSDNSNSQFALLGLWAARTYLSNLSESDLKGRLGDKVWEQIRDFYLGTQLTKNADNGSWNYSAIPNRVYDQHGSLTMTTAGICGLIISGMELNPSREKLPKDGKAINCGVYNENTAIRDALKWIGGPPFDRLHLGDLDLVSTRTYYNLYGIERLGRLTGMRFIGKHDWYREGCQFLVHAQDKNGSWPPQIEWPQINTCFALLFLSKGRTPVLISKLVHSDAWPRPDEDTDWNNDRNDLRNLTNFASKQLFKGTPLAWQNFDILRAAALDRERGRRGPALEDEDLLDVAADLSQSPILYFNGHKSPANRFNSIEKELLKKYIDNGGFLFVEACCSSPEFDAGFQKLARELWPKNPLEDLPADHPVWTSKFMVSPGNPYQLKGIKMGCSRTGLIYSPQDLSCQWESNNSKTGRGEQAFMLGANVIAYATGMEPPQPRLTPVKLVQGKDDPSKITRGYFKVGQLNQGGDWHPAPGAMHNLMDYLRRTAGLDVALKTEELAIDSRNLVDFKFIYLHGRAEFSFPVDKLKNLRFNLDQGGLLFSDACCGSAAFDKGFRKFAEDLYPEHKLRDVPTDDEFYVLLTKKAFDKHGEKLDLKLVQLDDRPFKCRLKSSEAMQSIPPLLEGIKIDNRWVVLYSKYDIGCALERHKSSDCLGYDTESAQRIAGTAVLYLLKLK